MAKKVKVTNLIDNKEVEVEQESIDSAELVVYVVADKKGVAYSTIEGSVILLTQGSIIDQKVIDREEIKIGTIEALLEDGRIKIK